MTSLLRIFKDAVRKHYYDPPRGRDLLPQFNRAKETPRSLRRKEASQHIEIRALRRSDWEPYVEARAQFLIEEKETSALARLQWMSRHQIQDLIYKHKDHMFGFFDGRQMVGIFEFMPCKMGTQVEIGNVWLAPAVRGLALTDRIFDVAMDYAARHPQVRTLTVQHHAGNLASKSANQRLGFVLTDAYRPYLVFGRKMKRYELQVRP